MVSSFAICIVGCSYVMVRKDDQWSLQRTAEGEVVHYPTLKDAQAAAKTIDRKDP